MADFNVFAFDVILNADLWHSGARQPAFSKQVRQGAFARKARRLAHNVTPHVRGAGTLGEDRRDAAAKPRVCGLWLLNVHAVTASVAFSGLGGDTPSSLGTERSRGLCSHWPHHWIGNTTGQSAMVVPFGLTSATGGRQRHSPMEETTFSWKCRQSMHAM